MKRTSAVRIRLVPQSEGLPIEIQFFEDERKEVEALAAAVGQPLSTFIRTLGTFAAQTEQGSSPSELIEAGSASAGMKPAQWLRIVVLAAIGYSDLPAQLGHARASLESQLERAKAAIPKPVPVSETTHVRPSARRVR